MLTVILTGGKSRRMGRDKALLEVPGGTMAQVLAQRYSAVLGEVVFSVDRAGRFDLAPFRELVDTFPGKGPMNGLYSAFHETDEDRVFLTATDMPCGDPALAAELAARMGEHDICTIVHENGYVEPLFSVYHRRCLPTVEECLRDGKHSLIELFRRHSVLEVPAAELSAWDPERVLMNVNTPEDYRKYKSGIQD